MIGATSRRRRIALGAAVLGGLILSRPSFCAAAPSDAPAFGERSFHVLHVPFMDFGPVDPGPLSPGRFTVSVETAYASTFSSTWHAFTYHRQLGRSGLPFTREEADRIHRDFPGERVFFLASDLLRVGAVARVGLSPALSGSVEIVYVSHDAIHGGSSVEAFHRIFGLDQSGRTEFPGDSFDIVVQRPHREIVYDDRVPASGIGDTKATLSWRPLRASRWGFGVDAAVKAPTGRAEDENGSGSWDAGAVAFARRDGERWTIDSEAGFVVPGRWRSGARLGVAPFGRLLLGATRLFGTKTRVGASATLEQSPFRREGLGDLSHPGLEIALGVERDLSSRSAAALTLTENVPSFGDRADFGLALRLRFR